ncbi:hypothetical protein RB596_008525 [Gaeumannomyces avenae]
MEPPNKRPRLLQYLGRDGDDELVAFEQEDLAPERQLEISRDRAAMSLKSRMELIFEKYGRDFSETTDEIDLKTGEVVVNNGHLESIFGSKSKDIMGDIADDDSDVTDLNGGGSDDESEEEEDEDEDEDQGEDDNEREGAQRGVPADPVPVDPDKATTTSLTVPETTLPQQPILGLAPITAWAGAPQSLISKINELLSAAAGGGQALQQATAPLDLLSMTNHTVESAWRVPALPIGPAAPVQPTPGGRLGSIRKRSKVPLKSLMRKVMAEADSEDEIQASAKEEVRESATVTSRQVSLPASEPKDALPGEMPSSTRPEIQPSPAPQSQPAGNASSPAEKQQVPSPPTPPDTSSSDDGPETKSYPAPRPASRARRSRKRRASGPAGAENITPIPSCAQQVTRDPPQSVDGGLRKPLSPPNTGGDMSATTAVPTQAPRAGEDIVIYIVDEGLRQLKLQSSTVSEADSQPAEEKQSKPLRPRRRPRGRAGKTAQDDVGAEPPRAEDTYQPMEGLAPTVSTEAGGDTLSVDMAAPAAEPAQSELPCEHTTASTEEPAAVVVPQLPGTPLAHHQTERASEGQGKRVGEISLAEPTDLSHGLSDGENNGWMARKSHAGRSRDSLSGPRLRTSPRPRVLGEVSGNRGTVSPSNLQLDIASAMTVKQVPAGLPSPPGTSGELRCFDGVLVIKQNSSPEEPESAEKLPLEEDKSDEEEVVDEVLSSPAHSKYEKPQSQSSPVGTEDTAKRHGSLGLEHHSGAAPTAAESPGSAVAPVGSSESPLVLLDSENDGAEVEEEDSVAIRAAAGPRRERARHARPQVRDESSPETSPDRRGRDESPGRDCHGSSPPPRAAYMLEMDAEAEAAAIAASSPLTLPAVRGGRRRQGSHASDVDVVEAAGADTPSRRPRSRRRQPWPQQQQQNQNQHRSTSPLISLIYDSDEDELSSAYFSSPGGSVRGVVSNNSDGNGDATAVRSTASLFNVGATTSKFPWLLSSSSAAVTPSSSFLRNHRRASFAAVSRSSSRGGAGGGGTAAGGGNTSPTNKNLRRRLFMTKASSSSSSAEPHARAVASLHPPATPRPGGDGRDGSSSSSRSSVRSRSSAGSVILTPGGSRRQCGQDGFRCDRDFCFYCLAGCLENRRIQNQVRLQRRGRVFGCGVAVTICSLQRNVTSISDVLLVPPTWPGITT